MGERVWTPSNVITLFRICLVPVFVVALLSPWPEWLNVNDVVDNQVKAWISAGIFIIISCTDWIDGYLARKRNEVTDFGKFLDPLADKILVAAALIALVELRVLPSWPVLIILAREFIVSGIRMVASSKGYVIAASWYGKVKTVLQIIAIVLFIIKGETDTTVFSHLAFYIVSWAFMLAALIMTVVSMMDYVAKARPILFPKEGAPEEGVIEDGGAEQGEGAFPAAPDGSSSARGEDRAPDGLPDGDRGECAADGAIDPSMRGAAEEVVTVAARLGVRIGTAESLTGGYIAMALTAVAGSSSVVNGGIVTYVNEMKESLLGVDAGLLDTKGPVCAECALQMAEGARRRLDVDIAVSVTGVAGPTGGTPEAPVGTVYMGISTAEGTSWRRLELDGDRDSVRRSTVMAALASLASTMGSMDARR